MAIEAFFQSLWSGYTEITPQAGAIHGALRDRGEEVVNDHVAFRTFDRAPISLDCLEPFLLELGYRRFAPYAFPLKKLRAWGYVHEDPLQPRVFFSELVSAEFSPKLRAVVAGLCDQIVTARVSGPEIFSAGVAWEPVTLEVYEALLAESDYAAWVAALGLRANHFTVSVNHLRGFEGVAAVADFVESLGFRINAEGGRVKGGPAELLEQASTMADREEVAFAGGERHRIPTCYYEFAKRYPDQDGRLYDGFVAASADRIFESTRGGD